MMLGFRVHIGFELPFWLALPEGQYSVAFGGSNHILTLNSSVDRVDIGDFYLGSGFKGVIWCNAADGEATRQELQRKNPGTPITRHPLKTVVTHIREVEAVDVGELQSLYTSKRRAWVDESLEIVNRLIDAYSLAALDDETRAEAGRVAFWDIGSVVVSFWDEAGSQQLGGQMEFVRRQMPRPEPLSDDRQRAFERLISQHDEYSLPSLLVVGGWGQIQRGNYRAAVVDDFNALELAVTHFARGMATGLGLSNIENVMKRLNFETVCKDLLPSLNGPRLSQWEHWGRIKEAQRIRNKVVHHGAHAIRSDALAVHRAAVLTLDYLRETAREQLRSSALLQ
jgi:hypothetical protein